MKRRTKCQAWPQKNSKIWLSVACLSAFVIFGSAIARAEIIYDEITAKKASPDVSDSSIGPSEQLHRTSVLPKKKSKAQAARGGAREQTLPDEVSVVVPQSILQFSTALDEENTHPWTYELALSNWAPSEFSEPSYLSNPSSFERSEFPSLSVNLWHSPLLQERVKVSAKYGVSLTQIRRFSSVDVLNVEIPVSQSVQVISGRVGLEFAPIDAGWFEPFLNVSALPTWALVQGSEVGEGGGRALLALEEIIGVHIRSAAVGQWFGLRRLGLTAGVQLTQGLRTNDLGGKGLMAGARIEL